MQNKKRTIGLLVLLAIVASIGIPKIINGNNTQTTSSVQKADNTNKQDKSSEINTEKKKNKKNTKGKKISKDKLEVDNLIGNQEPLASINATNDVFVNNFEMSAKKQLVKENIPQKNSVKIPEINETIPQEQQSEVPNPKVVMPQKENEVSKMALKAIAQSGNKIVAVIDYGGKRTTAFVGSMVGSEYIITDIDGDSVRLQSLSGETASLKLSR